MFENEKSKDEKPQEQSVVDERFKWTSFYMELASSLLHYKNRRSELIDILKTIFADAGMNFPYKEKGEVYEDICPFTVFGSFNKGITNANRIALLKQYAKQFSIKAEVPTKFDGIPVVMNLSAWFFAYKENRGEHDIDNLWNLFEKAIAYSDEASEESKKAFIEAYDTVIKQKMIKWNITMGLFWVRPFTFINLDSTNRAFITDVDNVPENFSKIFSKINEGLPDGKSYLTMCEQARNELQKNECDFHSFPELSCRAWTNNQSNKQGEEPNTIDSNVKETDYWLCSPGDNTQMQTEIKYPPYTKDDFLNEVYMDEDSYDTLRELLEAKYNVILQGAPGVGKTFAAKRLAYSIMGQKDISRVAMVQFHQSYSYEDFIQGYRPTKDGFELVNGVFYKFCKEAEKEDNKRPYFFIIDEINRGNLSKIFGELMMLIEKDKRGEKIKLLYSNEWFTVPENVRIIGMMNTADRSLALMDYALRRRFAFFEFAPAFSSDGFRNYLTVKNSPKLEKLISVVESLNNAISEDESLGDGFRIGHSYFCTDKEVTDEWLKSVVEYEVIPLIKEYWFDEPAKVRDWSANLRGAIK